MNKESQLALLWATNERSRATEKFHRENPHVYVLFKELAFWGIDHGATLLSGNHMWSVLRWNVQFGTIDYTPNPDDPSRHLKLNDCYTAYYVRLFLIHHPKYRKLFRLRQLKHELVALPEEDLIG